MKYIRTKDRLYCSDDIGFDKENFNTSLFGIYKLDCKPIYIKDIINQANTIEELCDEFVIMTKDKIITSNIKNTKVYCERGFIVYGAIWTDIGLTYVAKMNESGVLELL